MPAPAPARAGLPGGPASGGAACETLRHPLCPSHAALQVSRLARANAGTLPTQCLNCSGVWICKSQNNQAQQVSVHAACSGVNDLNGVRLAAVRGCANLQPPAGDTALWAGSIRDMAPVAEACGASGQAFAIAAAEVEAGHTADHPKLSQLCNCLRAHRSLHPVRAPPPGPSAHRWPGIQQPIAADTFALLILMTASFHEMRQVCTTER